jgi:tetratricopeptide (TPR) repeat protein
MDVVFDYFRFLINFLIASVYLYICSEFFKAGNYLAAISAYTHGIKISDKMAALYENRSAAHYVLENYCRCIEDCSKVIHILHIQISSEFQKNVIIYLSFYYFVPTFNVKEVHSIFKCILLHLNCKKVNREIEKKRIEKDIFFVGARIDGTKV